jgi:hypothetical protein
MCCIIINRNTSHALHNNGQACIVNILTTTKLHHANDSKLHATTLAQHIHHLGLKCCLLSLQHPHLSKPKPQIVSLQLHSCIAGLSIRNSAGEHINLVQHHVGGQQRLRLCNQPFLCPEIYWSANSHSNHLARGRNSPTIALMGTIVQF